MMNEKIKQKKQFTVILTIVFLGFLGISMPYLIFPALFLNPIYSILNPDWSEAYRYIFLGITLAVYPFGQFIGSPILGSLSDDFGRKKLLTGSLFISAACNLLTGFAIEWHHLGLLIASRFMAGLMEGNIAIARAMAADMNMLSKHKTFGKINAAASIAFLIGPLIGGLLTDSDYSEYLSASTPFYLICILFVILAIISNTILTSKIQTNIVMQPFLQRINIYNRLLILFTNKRLKFLMITSTLLTLAVDIFYEFGPVYLTIKWKLNPGDLVIYNGVLCLALAIGNGWLPSFATAHIRKKTILLYSIVSFIVFLIGITITNSPSTMLMLFALCGIVIGLAVTIITVKISDTANNLIQGEVMGVQMSLRVLGDAFICLLGGVLLIASAKIILTIATLLCIITLLYYILCKPKKATLSHSPYTVSEK